MDTRKYETTVGLYPGETIKMTLKNGAVDSPFSAKITFVLDLDVAKAIKTSDEDLKMLVIASAEKHVDMGQEFISTPRLLASKRIVGDLQDIDASALRETIDSEIEDVKKFIKCDIDRLNSILDSIE